MKTSDFLSALNAQRADAIFLSDLEPSHGDYTEAEIMKAVHAMVATCGGQVGCLARCAAEYGAHPELAASRMTWALELARTVALR